MALNRNLLWEVSRYEPKLVFVLECVSNTYNLRLSGDASYIQYFLEELYALNYARELTYAQCKTELFDIMQSRTLIHFIEGSRKIKFFDIQAQRAVTVPLTPPKGEYETNHIRNPYISWVLLSPSNVFFSDPWCTVKQPSAKNFSYDARRLKLTKQPSFEAEMLQHAFIFFERKIWKFGGTKVIQKRLRPNFQADLLSLGSEQWSSINPSPQTYFHLITAVFQRKFYLVDFLTTKEHNIYAFDPDSYEYTKLSMSYDRVGRIRKIIFATRNSLYVYMGPNLHILHKSDKWESYENRHEFHRYFYSTKWVQKSETEMVGINEEIHEQTSRFTHYDLAKNSMIAVKSINGKILHKHKPFKQILSICKMAQKKQTRKVDFQISMTRLLDTHDMIVIVDFGEVSTKGVDSLRKNLRGHATIQLGKNSLMSKVIKLRMADTTKPAKPEIEVLLPLLKCNTGLVFVQYKEEIEFVMNQIQNVRENIQMKAGTRAANSVIVPEQQTGIYPGKTGMFQQQRIPTRIHRGAIEVTQPAQLVASGQRITKDQEELGKLLKLFPIIRVLKIKYIYDEGIIWPPLVFLEGIPSRLVANASYIACLSQMLNVPTEASIGYSLANGFRILKALASVVDYDFNIP